MRLKALHIAALGLPLLMAGCIKNDLPYPRIQQNILSIAAEGESSAATISQDDLLVVLHLDETVNPRRREVYRFHLYRRGRVFQEPA